MQWEVDELDFQLTEETPMKQLCVQYAYSTVYSPWNMWKMHVSERD